MTEITYENQDDYRPKQWGAGMVIRGAEGGTGQGTSDETWLAAKAAIYARANTLNQTRKDSDD